MKKIITLSILILAVGSCTVQKRLYTGGYSIDFHRKHKVFHEKVVGQPVLNDALNEIETPNSISDTVSLIVPIVAQNKLKEFTVEKPKKTLHRRAMKVVTGMLQKIERTGNLQVAGSKLMSNKRMAVKKPENHRIPGWVQFGVLFLALGLLALSIFFPDLASIVSVVFFVAVVIAVLWIIFLLVKAIGNFS